MELFDQIGNIELKVRQLSKKSKRLQTENSNLLAENQVLKAALSQTQANQLIFIEKILHIKERMEAVEDERSTAAKAKLYLREIERCVDWLEEQQK
jgi:regulator of replication initiation timing